MAAMLTVPALQLLTRLAHEAAVLVTVQSVQGSGPRESGAWMAVFAAGQIDTVGGGHLEFEALALARAMLRDPSAPVASQRFALGPSLGQCCGGVVHLRFEPVNAADIAALRRRLDVRGAPLALFGGGHVGKALIRLLSELPFQVNWIDSRDEIFPPDVPANVVCEHSDPVQAAVRDLPAGAMVLIMSFSHAEDLDVLAACLQRRREQADLPWIGLIGSQTKWATFRHRLEQRGFTGAELDAVVCPIGLPGIRGKQPEVIAVSVAAQLLQQLAAGAG
jgi:xanthine dehydrogenase accessory factor